jgi:hypothetical protein
LLFVTSFAVLYCVTYYICAQQYEQSMDLARFDCHPDDGASQERCEARKRCWRLPIQQVNLTEKYRTSFQDIDVPLCYYPSDFPAYSILSNETTDFGQRIRIVKSQITFMLNDILDLTVDLIYETQQRWVGGGWVNVLYSVSSTLINTPAPHPPTHPHITHPHITHPHPITHALS